MVSEVSWLCDEVLAEALQIFGFASADIERAEENWSHPHTARALLDNPDQRARRFAAGTIEEVRVFAYYVDTHGCVFSVMQKA